MNPRLGALHPYPFERLRQLLAGARTPSARLDPVNLSIGEPKHKTPEVLVRAMRDAMDGLAKYPPTKGDATLRGAIADWLARRYAIPRPDPDTQVLPALGSREALFACAQAVIDPDADAYVVCPNPFYQIYEGAALLAGARPWYVNARADLGFGCDWDSVPADVWKQDSAGVRVLARQSGRQCHEPGRLEDAVRAVRPIRLRHRIRRMLFGNLFRRKRQAAGRDAGGAPAGPRRLPQPAVFLQPVEALERPRPAFRLHRGRCGAHRPVPALSHLSWQRHERGRVPGQRGSLERRAPRGGKPAALSRKIRGGGTLAGSRTGCRTATSLFLSLGGTPGPDTDFARDLYGATAVTVLPGSFLARDAHGVNPGAGRVRIALVANIDECIEAAGRIAAYIR